MAVATALAVASVVVGAASAVQQRKQARDAIREGRALRAEERGAQAAHEKEVVDTKARDEVSRAMFAQRRQQRAAASFATGARSTSTTGVGLSGFGGTGAKAVMGA